MTAVTNNPVDVILAMALIAPAILLGIGAALGWIAEHQPCDCLHCSGRRAPRSVPPASGKTR